MSRKCLTCSHSNKLDAERMYMQGKSISEISRKYGIPYDSLSHHMAEHLSRQLIKSQQVKDAVSGMTIIGDVEELIQRTKRILDEVEGKKKYDTAIRAIAEARQGYELLLKIAVALHETRKDELEAEQGWEEQQRNEEFTERLKILTNEELRMLDAITEKLNTQDKHMVIIGDALTRFDEVDDKPRFTRGKQKDINKLKSEEKTGTDNEEVIDNNFNKLKSDPDPDPLSDAELQKRYPWYNPNKKYLWCNGPQEPGQPERGGRWGRPESGDDPGSQIVSG